MRRREKFFISSLLMTGGLFAVLHTPFEWRLPAIVLYLLYSYAITSWALFENLNGVEWLTVVSRTPLYAGTVSLFFYLLPESFLSRTSLLFLFCLGSYALLLTSNIFTIAKTRTIQLLRAAHTVDFFLSIFMMILAFNLVFAQYWNVLLTGVSIFLIVFVFSLQSYWAIELEPHISKKVRVFAFTTALILAMLSMTVWLFPTTVWVRSLYLVSVYYAASGLCVTHLQGRLFQNAGVEYLGIWLLMSGFFLFFIEWK
jgi:hypothetical protein